MRMIASCRRAMDWYLESTAKALRRRSMLSGMARKAPARLAIHELLVHVRRDVEVFVVWVDFVDVVSGNAGIDDALIDQPAHVHDLRAALHRVDPVQPRPYRAAIGVRFEVIKRRLDELHGGGAADVALAFAVLARGAMSVVPEPDPCSVEVDEIGP